MVTGAQKRPGGLPRSSPTPTHQNRPSCPGGRTPWAGSSGRAAGRGALRPTPSLPPPGLNLSLQAAVRERTRPARRLPNAASRRPHTTRTDATAPAASNHQPTLRPRLRPEREAPPRATCLQSAVMPAPRSQRGDSGPLPPSPLGRAAELALRSTDSPCPASQSRWCLWGCGWLQGDSRLGFPGVTGAACPPNRWQRGEFMALIICLTDPMCFQFFALVKVEGGPKWRCSLIDC